MTRNTPALHITPHIEAPDTLAARIEMLPDEAKVEAKSALEAHRELTEREAYLKQRFDDMCEPDRRTAEEMYKQELDKIDGLVKRGADVIDELNRVKMAPGADGKKLLLIMELAKKAKKLSLQSNRRSRRLMRGEFVTRRAIRVQAERRLKAKVQILSLLNENGC